MQNVCLLWVEARKKLSPKHQVEKPPRVVEEKKARGTCASYNRTEGTHLGDFFREDNEAWLSRDFPLLADRLTLPPLSLSLDSQCLRAPLPHLCQERVSGVVMEHC